MISVLLALLLFDGSRFVCGSDGSLDERLRVIDARRPATSTRAAVEATSAPTIIEGTVVMAADDTTPPSIILSTSGRPHSDSRDVMVARGSPRECRWLSIPIMAFPWISTRNAATPPSRARSSFGSTRGP